MLFGLCGIVVVFFIKMVFGYSKVSDRVGRGALCKKKGQTGNEFKNNMKQEHLWERGLGLGSITFRCKRLSLGHCGSASLGCSGYKFGSKMDRVWHVQVQEGFLGYGKVCLSKLCLSPLPLRSSQPAPSLQSQSSGSWPSSPWLWHSGTRPGKMFVYIRAYP